MPEDAGTAAIEAIRAGDLVTLKRILRARPDLAHARPDGQRTLLHVATDWPGHFPNNVSSVAALITAGADPNAAFVGKHAETPLHWAASTDDVEVLDALLDRGANIEAPGSVIDGGPAMSDAVAFGQWKAARRLLERGAQTNLWQAAGLGLLPRVEERFASAPVPSAAEITNAFWCACHGGQQATAAYLLARGADLNWAGHNSLTPLDAARRSGAEAMIAWLRSRGARSAKDAG